MNSAKLLFRWEAFYSALLQEQTCFQKTFSFPFIRVLENLIHFIDLSGNESFVTSGVFLFYLGEYKQFLLPTKFVIFYCFTTKKFEMDNYENRSMLSLFSTHDQ